MPDFDAAALYLKQAKEAHEKGDAERYAAACQLVALALKK